MHLNIIYKILFLKRKKDNKINIWFLLFNSYFFLNSILCS